ncbi:MAG: helix-turn-helix domain-containing protein [Clostridia bacterium]|nr:helix-turn-helix domain-containing protein [Clostridia bacterium]
MSIGENIKRLREAHGLTQIQLAEIACVTDKAVSTWENDLKTPRMGALQKIADYFGIAKSDIIEDSKAAAAIPHPSILPVTTQRVPLMGTIACGEPILAEADVDTFAVVGRAIECDFALRCSGDSMIGARIFDGDVVFIKKQDYVDDGAIAAVLLDDEATLKRVYHLADGRVELRAENPMYKSIIVGGDNETRICRILGKAVAFQSTKL